MDELPMDETIEIDGDRFIQLLYERVWPKYVVTWSVRRRVSQESDFPLASGTAEALPPREGPLDAVWARLRDEAVGAATAAAGSDAPRESRGRRGFLRRIFGS